MASLSKRVLDLVRPEVAALSPYDPNFTPCKINLSANENTYDLPVRVRTAINEALATTPTNRYPDPMANELRDQIALWHGVHRENVCVGNGGDELLFNFFLAFGGPGKRLVDCPPTFTVYEIYSKMLGTSVVRCWRDSKTFELDMDALLPMVRTANMVIITSPNNPTGNTITHDDAARLCQTCPGIVMIDEAYIEFADKGISCEDLLSSYDNLVILHTYSKAFCLAGVRVGYVLAAPDVIDVLAAVRQPYTVDVFAQATAQVVTSMRGVFLPTIKQIRYERERLERALAALEGVQVWPSQGNFLLVRMPHAGIVRAHLRDKWSILVRDFSSTPGLDDCLRITVGMPEENDALIDALAAVLREVA
ncbi:MAG: histidinol-phosphate transaminase [Atopobiaceae bacterium]|nr:histidinol-phosphate transaminase [Atopobiaceae bacterium]